MLNKLKNLIKSYIYPAKKYHWYAVRYIYKENGITIFDFASEIGLAEQKNILNRRYIKKIVTPLHRIPFAKTFLHNGVLSVETICYLGLFSK